MTVARIPIHFLLGMRHDFPNMNPIPGIAHEGCTESGALVRLAYLIG